MLTSLISECVPWIKINHWRWWRRSGIKQYERDVNEKTPSIWWNGKIPAKKAIQATNLPSRGIRGVTSSAIGVRRWCVFIDDSLNYGTSWIRGRNEEIKEVGLIGKEGRRSKESITIKEAATHLQCTAWLAYPLPTLPLILTSSSLTATFESSDSTISGSIKIIKSKIDKRMGVA